MDFRHLKLDRSELDSKQRKAPKDLDFEHFLLLFPPAELPLNLSLQTESYLTAQRELLHSDWLEAFLPNLVEELDEYTEVLPCFSLPSPYKFHLLIYWKAHLNGSDYFLASFSPSGVLIQQQRLAGLAYSDEVMRQTLCQIAPNLTFSTMEGDLDASTGALMPLKREQQTYYQISEQGEIIEI